MLSGSRIKKIQDKIYKKLTRKIKEDRKAIYYHTKILPFISVFFSHIAYGSLCFFLYIKIVFSVLIFYSLSVNCFLH